MPAVLTKSRHPMRNTYTPVRRPTQVGSRKRPAPRSREAVSSTLPDAAALRRALLWMGGLGIVLAAFFGLSAGLMQLYRYCTTSDYFLVQTIDIQGIQQLDEEDILKLSGLYKGQNSLSIHIPDIEKRLLGNPWIENVSIKRHLPDSFIIHIKERIPQFWVLKEGSLYYLDKGGLLIAPVESENFHSLPTLDIGPGGENALPYLSDFMSQIQTVDFPFDLSQISWLRISAGKGFELYWENKHLSLSIGIEHWRQNLRRLALVIDDMEKRKEIGQTREIRAADGQVWLQKA